MVQNIACERNHFLGTLSFSRFFYPRLAFTHTTHNDAMSDEIRVRIAGFIASPLLLNCFFLNDGSQWSLCRLITTRCDEHGTVSNRRESHCET